MNPLMLIGKFILELALFVLWAFIVLVVGCCMALSSRADELLEGEEPAATTGQPANGERQS